MEPAILENVSYVFSVGRWGRWIKVKVVILIAGE